MHSTLGAPETSTDNFGMTTLGTRNFKDTFEYNSMTYTRQVKKTFEHKPETYREFVQILSEVSQPSSDKVELVKRVIVLFEGYPELIRGFSYFLPPDITIEVQSDAVIVNVEEEEESDHEDFESNEEDTDTIRYIRNIKWTYMHQPEIYEKFSVILQGLNRKNVTEMDAVSKIANLFEGQRDLVLGFNIFLPDDYKIMEHEKRGFLIRHPCKKGMNAHYTPINVTEEYIS